MWVVMGNKDNVFQYLFGTREKELYFREIRGIQLRCINKFGKFCHFPKNISKSVTINGPLKKNYSIID